VSTRASFTASAPWEACSKRQIRAKQRCQHDIRCCLLQLATGVNQRIFNSLCTM
jgi:hypothetical protein